MSEPSQIRKLVALAATGDTPEARNAAAMARRKLAALDTELLDTLASQRQRLLEELREESQRLWRPGERATKTDTGALVSSALVLLRHFEKIDELIPAVMLLRIEGGHQLTNEERQQLDGPVEDFLSQWSKQARERRRTEREARKKRRKEAKAT